VVNDLHSSEPAPIDDSPLPPQTGALVIVIVFVVLGWAVIVSVEPGGPHPLNAILAGLLMGTMFGQVSLSAAWCALGPFRLVHRLPLAGAWLAMIVIAFGCNQAFGAAAELIVLLVFGGGMLLQWLLVQGPLWLLAAIYGLHVVHRDDAALKTDRRHQQFGIRQLMILTALVAVVLGIGRWTLGGMSTDEFRDDWQDGVLILSFLGICNSLIAFPLVAAALLPRWTVPAVVAALALVAVATALEVPLLEMISKGGESWILWLMNGVQAAWILGVLLLLRLGRYRLSSRSRRLTA
jgi:hypothetical protein